jgi:hypothetical protein
VKGLLGAVATKIVTVFENKESPYEFRDYTLNT